MHGFQVKIQKMQDFEGFLIKNLNLQICQELVDEQKSFLPPEKLTSTSRFRIDCNFQYFP